MSSRWPRREAPDGELRSFGRRRGRGGSPRKDRLFADLLPALTIDLGRSFPEALGPIAHKRPLWLEVGFGGGEHLLWQAEHAEANPLIMGCEPFKDGVAV
jgi:tRNA (guanine-N7-)-methyltransferase